MKNLAATLLLLVAVPARSAEVPRLLADINTDPATSSDLLPLPGDFFELGGRLFFSTADTRSGDEGLLWSTDGTPDGLGVVSSKVCPAPCRKITPVARLGGTVLLRATQGADFQQSIRYWRTDGTPSGTSPLTGSFQSFGEEAVEMVVPGSSPANGLFYFVGNSPDAGMEIWRSDGTAAGTFLVKDLYEGPAGSYPHSLAAWGGRLYFLAEDHEEGAETGRFGLWSTDGTAQGTRFLHEVGEAEGSDSRVLATPSHLFFTSGEEGEDLWTTDGTPEGPRLLHDFEPQLCPGGHPRDCPTPYVNSLVAVGDTVYFFLPGADHESELWESDGTVGGTRPFPVFLAGASPALETFHRSEGRWVFLAEQAGSGSIWTAGDQLSDAEPLTGCEGGSCPGVQGLFFEGPDPGHLLFASQDPAHGNELWITDGTAAGTRRLSDACPGACNGIRDYLSPVLGSSQGRTWFLAYPSPAAEHSDTELWVTDGTPGGTRRAAGHVEALGFLDGTAYFGVAGAGGLGGYTSELWAADGSSASARRVTILRRSAPGSFPLIVPLAAGGALISPFEDTQGPYRLWRSDGTPGGTRPVTMGPLLNSPLSEFFPVGPLYFFTVFHPISEGVTLEEIWRTDGTDRGTRRMATLGTGRHVLLRRAWNGKLLFAAGGPKGCSFWTSDGTRAGTTERLPLSGGVRCPTGLHPFGSRFLFVSPVEQAGGLVPQLFVSDGTPAGTRQLTRFRSPRGFYEFEFAGVGGVAFFRLDDRTSLRPEIWRTDGTRKGTRRAFPGLVASFPLQAFRGSLYFIARPGPDFGPPYGLFRATSGGAPPVLLASGSPDDALVFVRSFTPAGDRLFFTLRDDEAGQELWATDGTPGGTRRVRDIQPGPGSSAPEGLTAVGNRVYFRADDGEHGRELWVSDGTAEGTRLVWDLNPGGFSSNPQSLAVSGGNLFFSADDGETGQEPWVLRLAPQ